MLVDIVEDWLNSVAYSHSNSSQTKALYRLGVERFLVFIGKTAEEVLHECETTSERDFRRRYASYVRAYVPVLQKQGYAPATINSRVAAIRSFFKYNDMALGFVPSGSNLIENHNRDMSKEEILETLKIASVRDRAFYAVMVQSGLRPNTISNLKIADVERLLETNTPIPAEIRVRRENTKGKFMEYFSFIGVEAISYVKDYLKTRAQTSEADYLFTKFGHEDNPLSSAVMSHLFSKSVFELRKRGIVKFETSEKKIHITTRDDRTRDIVSRSELRLYCLRKYFRKYAGMAGPDYVNFWMGHTSALGVDLHYFSRDVEHHRQIYAEKAMPFLRLESKTPSETEKRITEQTNQIEELRRENAELKSKMDSLAGSSKALEALLKRVEELEKRLKN